MNATLKTLIVALPCLGAGFAGARLSRVVDPRPAASPAAAPARTAVTALGRIEPAGEVAHVSAPAGDVVLRVLVREGQRVAAGDALAELQSLALHRASCDQIRAQLASADAQIAAETSYARANVVEARAGVSDADELGLEDIRAQEARVRAAELVLELAAHDRSTFAGMNSRGVSTTWDLEHAALAERRAAEDVTAANATLERLKQGREHEVVRARARLQSALAAEARAVTAIPRAALAGSLREAEARAELSVVRAPQAGQVLRLLTRAGEATGKTILELGDADLMYVRAEVWESDIRLVRPGQRAEVTSRAFERPIGGTVERLGAIVMKQNDLDHDPTADTDARVVEVLIKLDPDPAAASLIQLQVDVRIPLAAKS